MLSPESLNRLTGLQGSYEEGLERGNPPPANGTYVALFKKITNRTITTKKGDMGVVEISLRIVGDHTYNDYDFVHTFWDNSMNMSQFSTFPTALKGRPVPKIVEGYALMDEVQGQVYFQIQIGRTKPKDVEYVELTAVRKMEAQQVAPEAAAPEPQAA